MTDLNRATETDTAQPIGVSLLLDRAVETDAAQPVGVSFPVDRAIETDIAQPVGVSLKLDRAVETGTAQPVGVSLPLDRATETDTARPVGVTLLLGRVAETDTAGTIGISFPLGRAIDSQIAQPVTIHKPAVLTKRWVLHDPVADETWTMPINPDRMSSPFPPREMRFAVSGHDPTRPRTFLMPPPAHEWEWSGVIRTKGHHDQLEHWCRKNNAVEVTDHLERTFVVVLQKFDPTDRRPTANVSWRLRYAMKALVLEVR